MNTDNFIITPQLVANLAEQYIEMPAHPDWSALSEALSAIGADACQKFEVMYAIRQGDY